MIKNIVFLCIAILNAHGLPFEDDGSWNGKWFPHSPEEPDLNPEVTTEEPAVNVKHGVAMGTKNRKCDNARLNLQVDWYLSPINYTCFDDRRLYLPNSNVHPEHTEEHIPAEFQALHLCMNETIEYSEPIPTFGYHRPHWGAYGEYIFIPKQRWVHNLEHGAVVMLYHPCAEKNQVRYLKKLVKSCLYRHIITPYDQLTPERPLALVTWGHRLEMSKVSLQVVVDFIMHHALKGPEKLYRDGMYDLMLKEPSEIVSSITDNDLCPNDQDRSEDTDEDQ